MIERILAPLDGSLTAEAALPQARRLARATGAEIMLVQAVPVEDVDGGEPVFRAAAQAATAYLAGVKERLDETGFRTRMIVRAGGAAETVLGVAAETRAGLLVLATHGRSGAERLVLGSTAEKILRSTPVPVWAVRPFWTYELQPKGGVEAQPVRTILVPVTAGGLSLCVLPHAVEMARLFGAGVTILHVRAAEDEGFEATVQDVVARFRLEGVEAGTRNETGDPTERILSAAREADLAILSTRGRRGLSRLVLGSVTEEVLRRARVPLLVVRGDPAAQVVVKLRDAAALKGAAESPMPTT